MCLNIGVDLGGTKIKAALVGEGGRILKETTRSVEGDRSLEAVTGLLIDAIGECLPGDGKEREAVESIGIGAAGQIDAERGVILFSPNLDWRDVPICREIRDLFPYPVFIENDVRVAALGEHAFGAGKGIEDLICVFVGTGVGSGIFVNGRLLRGASNMAGEIGHIKIELNGLPCTCGGRGCLEAYAGGGHVKSRVIQAIRQGVKTSIGERVGGRLEQINVKVVEEAARDGDPYARKVWAEISRALGIGMANLVTLFNPGRLIMGGGVIEASPSLVEEIEGWIDREVTMLSGKDVEVVKAALGADAGVIGASLLISGHGQRPLR